MKIKQSAQVILLGFFSILIVFLFQNCGMEKGAIFGDCIGEHCSWGSKAALRLDFSTMSPPPANGSLIPIGIISDPGDSSYNNLYLSGKCSRGGFARHQIRWAITPGSGIAPNRGTTTCDSQNYYSIAHYVNNLDKTRLYNLDVEIVGLDKYDNPVYGEEDSSYSFILKPVEIPSPPILYASLGDESSELTSIEVIKDKSDIYFQGLCDYSGNSSQDTIQVSYRVAKTSTSYGFGETSSIICQKKESGSPGFVPTQDKRSGFFTKSFTSFKHFNIPSDGFLQTNSRVYQVEFTQTATVNNTPVSIKVYQPYLFINTGLGNPGAKGWTAETLKEVALRVKKTLTFNSYAGVELNMGDKGFLQEILNARDLNVNDDCLNPPPTGCTTKKETFSLRRYLLSLLRLNEAADPTNSGNLSLKVSSENSNFDFIETLKYMVSSCGVSSERNPVITMDGNAPNGVNLESQKLAACFARYFYYGLHGETQAQRITQYGLNLSSDGSTCRYIGGSVGDAPKKYCEKVRELLFAEVKNIPGSGQGPVLPKLGEGVGTLCIQGAGTTCVKYTLPGIAKKFLPANRLINELSDSRPSDRFYAAAIGQLFVNSIMREISRHLVDGVSQSYFIKHVLSSAYNDYLNPNKKDIFYDTPGVAPKEVNYKINNNPGPNNFSAYTSVTTPGSHTARGSATCTVSGSGSSSECK